MRGWLRLVLMGLGALFSARAAALTYHLGTQSGLMVQPTSNYYHAVYGAYAEVARSDNLIRVRATYLERPAFRSAGFIDQEFFGFAMLGTKVAGKRNHGLSAFLGAGQTTGYVAVDRKKYPDLGYETRRYRVPGLVTELDYEWNGKWLHWAASHQLFIGHMSDEHLKAYVAWPYQFLVLRFGVLL